MSSNINDATDIIDVAYQPDDTQAEDDSTLPIHTRAYQLEMFELSMQGNIVVAVSGLSIYT
jgi:hypothetical protein